MPHPDFSCLFFRNLRRITSGPTLKHWRLLGTEPYLSRSLLKSPDTLKCRSSVGFSLGLSLHLSSNGLLLSGSKSSSQAPVVQDDLFISMKLLTQPICQKFFFGLFYFHINEPIKDADYCHSPLCFCNSYDRFDKSERSWRTSLTDRTQPIRTS